nr:2851_t:CDS:2 [Entrophospora candida]
MEYADLFVIGFNLCIAGIYGYTLYQDKQNRAQREAFLLKQQKELLKEINFSEEDQAKITKSMNQIASEQTTQILGFANPFSTNIPTSQKAENFSQLVQQQILEKEQIAKKEQEIQQQAETLKKAAEIENNLKEISTNLEFEKAEKILRREESEQDKNFLNRLERLPIPSEEEQILLSNLNLTLEQYIAISLKTPYLTKLEEEFIIENYPTLDLPAKLQLLSSGLNNLGIDTYEKKEKLIELILTCQSEQLSFGLNAKEKEGILRLLMNTLNLSSEQKENLEQMGIKLTEEQAEELTAIHPDQFKTFSLTGQQKNILNNLAPLIREDKYSESSLTLLKSLNLKPNIQIFLVQEEIIPDPHTAFGTAKSSYLPLKEKFLLGEQRTLQKVKEEEERELKEEKIKQNKLSILRSLMNFAENKPEIEDEEFRFHRTTRKRVKNYLRDELTLTPEEVLNQGNLDYLREQFTNSQEKGKSSTSSRYDNLFANLNKEEAERKKKKLEREEAQKKLQEAERLRRQEKLSEKDKKLKEDEERRKQERELAEQETKKKRQAEEARNKALQEEQEAFLTEKLHNIEEKRKRAEQALENQRKENELQEKKKKDQIEKMEKKNRQEQARLAKQAQLIEEEKKKKLAAIALEDQEERQRIEKKMNEEKAKVEAEMKEKQRLADEALEKAKIQAEKERKEREQEITNLQRAQENARKEAEELTRLAQNRERILREQKGRENQLEAHREYL